MSDTITTADERALMNGERIEISTAQLNHLTKWTPPYVLIIASPAPGKPGMWSVSTRSEDD